MLNILNVIMCATLSLGAVADDLVPKKKEAISSVAGATSVSLFGLGKLYQSQRIQEMTPSGEADASSLVGNALRGDKVVIIHEFSVHNLQKLVDEIEFERERLIGLIESDKKQRRYFAVEVQLEKSEYIRNSFSRQLARLDDSIERYTNRLVVLDLALKNVRPRIHSGMRIVKEFEFHDPFQKNIQQYLGNMEKEGYQVRSISRLPIKQYRKLNSLLIKSRASFIGAAIGAVYFLEELTSDLIVDFLDENNEFEIEINQGQFYKQGERNESFN